MAEKGLKSNVVGLFGGTMLGISSVAPAYALTITLGLLAASRRRQDTSGDHRRFPADVLRGVRLSRVQPDHA